MPRLAAPLLLVYTVTLFFSAFLLFLVQPLIGKLIVPLLGGSPAVWNTCMVFFQAVLLIGYAYAHVSTNWLGERKQGMLHLGVLLLPVIVLPLGVAESLVPPGEANPIPGLLLMLTVSVGLPFFAVSTTAPLLQRWFANTDHPAARDPYFLYAASNVGSMLALFAYPFVVQRFLDVPAQEWGWTISYGLVVLLIAVCAFLLWSSSPRTEPEPIPVKDNPGHRFAPTSITAHPPASPFRRFVDDFDVPPLNADPEEMGGEITLGRALRWIALAFVPSSLMLGVTTYITTDIAAIPLLWVLPLALYLLSFILVFSRLPALIHKIMVLAMPVLLLLLVFVMVTGAIKYMWQQILFHLLVLFVVAMVCHGELARTRPAARHLTKFFLLMSVGGVLGGMFNALLAPMVFKTLAEYPIALVLAALLLPRMDDRKQPTLRTYILDFALPLGVGALAMEFYNGFPVVDHLPGDLSRRISEGITTMAGQRTDVVKLILTYAPPLLLCYLFVERPFRFGLSVALVLLASTMPALWDRDVIYRDRSFFGTLKIKNGPDYRSLYHGNILHGMQARLLPETVAGCVTPLASTTPLEGLIYAVACERTCQNPATEAITYYHRTGPIGQMFAALPEERKKDIAVIGLGTGTMACYARPGRSMTFYEIDRTVKAISYDRDDYFSYVQAALRRGADVNIVLGDARLQLQRERETRPEQKYDLIIVDAFSSDSIPVHLVTREALGIYLDKLKEDGIIAFHTSNRYLELDPVVGNLAADRNLVAVAQNDGDESAPGKSASSWVLVTRNKENLGGILDEVSDGTTEGKPWHWLEMNPKYDVWTDHFSDLLDVFIWTGK